MKIKIWKLWMAASICYLFLGGMYLIEKKYTLGCCNTFIGICFIILSRSYYKRGNKLNKVAE